MVPSIPHTALCFRSLVRYLSQAQHLPTSLGIRNKLLRTYSFPQQWEGPIPDPEPWRTFFGALDKGCSVWAFGDVPKEVLVDSSNSGTSGEGLWALLILTSDRPIGIAPPTTGRRVPRIDVWISSESQLNRYDPAFNNKAEDAMARFTDQTDPESQEIRSLLRSEEALFKHIAFEWLPPALEYFLTHLPGQASEPSQATDLPVLFCCLAQRFSSLLVSHVNERTPIHDPRSEKAGSSLVLDQDFENPCVLYVRSAPAPSDATVMKLMSESGWSIDTIQADDVDLVQRSNKLPFPATYIEGHRNISTLLRRSPSAISISPSSEPTSGQNLPVGPVGWCYAHDVLTIASLHTLPEFRRQRIPLAAAPAASSSASPPSTGVARLVVADFEIKIHAAQWRAVRCSGAFSEAEVDELASAPPPSSPLSDGTPSIAISEVPNPARNFFEHIGFVPSHGVSWTQVVFKDA